MRNYKLLSWISGIALIFGLFCATEAMAQPAPAPAHHGNSWLSKPLKHSSMVKAIPKDKLKAERMKAAKHHPDLRDDRPLPPPGQAIPKDHDPKFDKKRGIHHEDGLNSAPHRKHMDKHPDHERKGPGPKPHVKK